MKKEWRNKGFSLVELIIVIAIMAIISAAVAPMLIRYIEKSKVATDRQASDEIARVLANELTADTMQFKDENSYLKITVNKDGMTFDAKDVTCPMEHIANIIDGLSLPVPSTLSSIAKEDENTFSSYTIGPIDDLKMKSKRVHSVENYDNSSAIEFVVYMDHNGHVEQRFYSEVGE